MPPTHCKCHHRCKFACHLRGLHNADAARYGPLIGFSIRHKLPQRDGMPSALLSFGVMMCIASRSEARVTGDTTRTTPPTRMANFTPCSLVFSSSSAVEERMLGFLRRCVAHQGNPAHHRVSEVTNWRHESKTKDTASGPPILLGPPQKCLILARRGPCSMLHTSWRRGESNLRSRGY